MKRDDDKRLIIPKDAFEEEASEGLGRLNQDEAAKDLHDLEMRMARRLRKPIRVWIPAAAAVIIILIASTIYIGLFRDRQPAVAETAMAEGSQKDTVLIAMAEPLSKAEAEAKVEVKKSDGGNAAGVSAAGVAAAREVSADEVMVMVEEEGRDDIIQIIEEEEVAGEVIVEMMPERAKAAQGIPVARAETRAAKNIAVADREKEYKADRPDHAPLPLGGIEELNRRISSIIHYPADIAPLTVQEVIVTFKVRTDSTIYDLRAERTPGGRFTEEAFRVLREGPGWEPALRNGTPAEEQVKVRITFKEQ